MKGEIDSTSFDKRAVQHLTTDQYLNEEALCNTDWTRSRTAGK